MAGIGFELRKVFNKSSLHNKLAGVIYASMTTIGPTIIFVLLLVGINIAIDMLGVGESEQLFFSSACLYVFVMAIIISSAINTISARFTSDAIYEEQEEIIPATMFGTIFVAFVPAAVICFIISFLLNSRYDISKDFLIAYYFFGIMITITYTIMTFISAIKEYRKITKAYFIGILFAVISFFFFLYILKITILSSIMYGLVVGFFIINLLIIYYIITYFKKSNSKYFQFISYYKRYPYLFLSGLCYILGLYIANIVYWFFSEVSERVTIFYVAPPYDMASFIAILVNLSATVIFTVKVETEFFEKYKDYVTALNGANYAVIEKNRKIMCETINIQLFYIYEMQLIITIILTCISVILFPLIGLGGLTLDFFLLLGIAVYCIFSMYFTVIFLYYFDDQLGSFITTLIFLVVTAISAVIAVKLGIGYYSMAPLLGGLVAWIFGFLRLKYFLKDINAQIFCRNIKSNM